MKKIIAKLVSTNCLRLFFHRRFKTCYFREQVKLCNVASEMIKGF